MYNYTVTFVSNSTAGLTDCCEPQSAVIASLLAEKLCRGEFELADFNWSGNYSPDNSLAYLERPYKIKAVVEVVLVLDRITLQSREAIYERCLAAVLHNEVQLQHYDIFGSSRPELKCIACFQPACTA